MNYLAHARLSFDHAEILVGNMISDFIKGKKRFDYEEGIQKGITLHRNIDAFTDEHETTKQAKQFFKPIVGLYAGAFVDVVYDHFLANDEDEFKNDDELLDFTLSVYAVLDKHRQSLPERFSRLFPYMRKENWLYNYRTLWGTEKSFGGLMHRAKYLEYNSVVFESFQKNYVQLKKSYQSFFPAVKAFAHHQFTAITNLH
jgi:acyl carrier protein phosphodiesterase